MDRRTTIYVYIVVEYESTTVRGHTREESQPHVSDKTGGLAHKNDPLLVDSAGRPAPMI